MNPDQTAPLGPYCLQCRLPKDILTAKFKHAQENSVVRLTEHLIMTIAVGWDVKPHTTHILKTTIEHQK